jgi:hypothetical protein
MRCRFRRISKILAGVLAAVATASSARAAITVFSDPADVTFLPSNTRLSTAVSSVGARTSSEPGSRTVLYIFQLPQSDTGIAQVKSAKFSLTFVSPPSRSPTLGTPTTYDIDLYGLPARSTTETQESDNYIGGHDPATLLANGRSSDVLITPNLFPRNTPLPPTGEFVTSYDSATSMVNYLNAQYGSDASGTGKYIFLRLNDDQLPPLEDTGGYVNMGKATTGRPYLSLTFVPEPSLAFAAVGLLTVITLRRRQRHRD